jgi:DNA-binding beta-propeller fold protein YncE
VSDQLEEIASRRDGLNTPQDLAFNPEREGELWVVNRKDDSVTIVFDATSGDRTTEHIVDPYALHFMDRVSSIAFGAPGTFATCQDSRNTYNGAGPGDDFMGPALWSSDLDVFGTSNPEAVETLTQQFGMPTDLGSHLDMLHESPLCVGIAWDHDNVYWVFDGNDGALVRYDFVDDHGVGWDDHSDGIISRYVSGEVKRRSGTVAHLALDHDTGELFAADAGNGRIVVLDTNSGNRGRDLPVMEPGTDHHAMRGVELEVFADRDDGLDRPAGIDLVDDYVVVTDVGDGHVRIFDRAGELLSDLDTGLGEGALAGIHAVATDDLWLVDADGNRVLRLQR